MGDMNPDSALASEEAATHIVDETRRCSNGVHGRSRCRTSRRPSGPLGAGLRGSSSPARRTQLGAGTEPPRPDRSPRGAGADAASGARPDPVRAHARVAVRLLPRRRLVMAADLADGPRTGLTPSSAVTRTSPTSASSRRRTGGSCSASTTSTRRCRPVRVGRQAARRSFAVAGRDRGFDEASAARGRARRRRASTARRWRASPRCANIDVWYARLDVDDDPPRSSAASVRARRRSASRRTSPSGGRRTACGRSPSCADIVDGELRIVGDPPLITPIEDVLPGAEQEHSRTSSGA